MMLALLLLAAPIDDARAVEVSGDVQVRIGVGKKALVQEAKGVTVTIADGVVIVKAPARADGERPTIQVALSALESIETSGAARVVASDVGADGNRAGKSLRVRAVGTSDVQVNGKSLQSLDVHASSSARVDVQKIPAASVNVTVTDAARVTVRAAQGGSVTATATKAARLVVLGKPAKLEKTISGAARIE